MTNDDEQTYVGGPNDSPDTPGDRVKGRLREPTPNEVAAGEAEPTSVIGASAELTDEARAAGFKNAPELPDRYRKGRKRAR